MQQAGRRNGQWIESKENGRKKKDGLYRIFHSSPSFALLRALSEKRGDRCWYEIKGRGIYMNEINILIYTHFD